MVTHVALERLDRAMYRSSVTRERVYEAPLVLPADWDAIVRCVRNALAFDGEAPGETT
jgi:hypothetical protein